MLLQTHWHSQFVDIFYQRELGWFGVDIHVPIHRQKEM
ncbi:uncharacterized protein METZ01_LOCUS259573, partial [marine metagenome]